MVEKGVEALRIRPPEEIIGEIKGKGARGLKRQLTGLVGDWAVAEKPKQRRKVLRRLLEMTQEKGIGEKRAAQITELHSTLVAQHTERRAAAPAELTRPAPAEPAPPLEPTAPPPEKPPAEPPSKPSGDEKPEWKPDYDRPKEEDLEERRKPVEGPRESGGKARGMARDEEKHETVQTEEGLMQVPRFEGKSIQELHRINREFLEELILTNRYIREDHYEHHFTAGIMYAAKKIADPKGEGSNEMSLYREIKKEYEGVRRALQDWHEAVVGKKGMSYKPPDTYGEAINLGKKYDALYPAYFATNSHWRDDFLKGFAGEREKEEEEKIDVNPVQFESAAWCLGAMFRMRSSIGVKDGKKKDTGEKYTWSDGSQVWVIDRKGKVKDRCKSGNGFVYEDHKTMNPLYYLGYRESRLRFINAAYEFSHLIFDPKDPENPEKARAVYVCHFDADSFWAYDAFQHPKYMPKVWYENLKIAKFRKAMREAGQTLGEDFLGQLGWDHRLSADDNLALLGEAKDFLNLTLQKRKQLGWNEALSDDENLINLGLLRTHGDVRHDKYYRITCNIINLNTERIPINVWKEFLWNGEFAKTGGLLGDHAQQKDYMQSARNHLISLLMGDNIQEALDFLGSGSGWRHIPDSLAWVVDRERSFWYESITQMQLLTLREYRERGNRQNLAEVMRGKLSEGLLEGSQKRIWFEACGIENMSWRENLSLIEPHQRTRQLLQGINEVKIIRETLLSEDESEKAEVTYKDLAADAGLKIKTYRMAPVHLPLDPETAEWDTEFNKPFLEAMKKLLNDMPTRFLTSPDDKTGSFTFQDHEARDKWIRRWRREPKNERLLQSPIGFPGKGKAKMDLLAVFEEWKTEVNLKLMRDFLNLSPNERKAWIQANWQENVQNRAEEILQIWPEFEEMTDAEWQKWRQENPNKERAIMRMTIDWPKRNLWGWGGLDIRGKQAPGAEVHQMARWSVAEDYVATFYEKKRWPWRLYGCRFNEWEREKRLFRVIRRQRASMDLRPDNQKKLETTAGGKKIHVVEDRIINEWFYDQLEWNPHEPFLNRHDRYDDVLRGIDRLAALEMSTGEAWPGNPKEVSPLWWGHTDRRMIFRRFTHGSVGYRWDQAKVGALEHNMTPHQYWEAFRLDRLVQTPGKRYKIIEMMSKIFLDDDYRVTYQRTFGCTQKEIIASWGFRKQLRIPDEEDKVREDVDPQIKQAMITVGKELQTLPGSPLWAMLTGGRTSAEVGKMVRNAGLAGAAASLGLDTFILTISGGQAALGPIMIATLPIGIIAGALTGFDRGDLVGGLAYIAGRAGLMKEREVLRGPEVILTGYYEPHIVKILPRPIKIMIKPFLSPAVNDDTINASEEVEAHSLSRAKLGSEGIGK